MNFKSFLSTTFTGKNLAQNLLAYFWSAFGAFYIWNITFSVIPDENIRVVDTIVGFLMGTIVSTIISYYFGSSKSSSDKNEMLKTNATEAPVVDFSDTRIAQLVSLGWKAVSDGYELNGNIITNEQLKTLSVSEFNALIK